MSRGCDGVLEDVLAKRQVYIQKGLIRLEIMDTANGADRIVPRNEALTATLKDAMSSPVCSTRMLCGWPGIAPQWSGS
jgi:hypothetical protein